MSAVSRLLSLDCSLIKEDLFKTIDKTRQAYSQAKSRNLVNSSMEEGILQEVRKWRRSHPKMGSRTCYYSMKAAGIEISIGVNKFEMLLSEKGLTVGQAKRSGPRTSDGEGKRAYPNLANGLMLNNINQLVVADITYFWVKDRWYYIFTLKDAYSQRLISLIPSSNMEAINAVRTLEELCIVRGINNLRNCIHHSDNGSQYEAEIFKNGITKLEMKISRAKECKQNGSSEQLNHIVKNMYLKHMGINSGGQLAKACKKVKKLMNRERAVKQLDNLTVNKFESKIMSLPSNLRPKKKLHDFDDEEGF